MILAYIPKLVQWVFYKRLWHKSRQHKSIYLTFDDGPIPQVTQWVIEQLKQYNAKATFFCIGDNVKKHQEEFNTILRNGHTIGNHTFNHVNGWYSNTNQYIENVQLCSEQMSKYIALHSKLFRPPYGKLKAKQAKQLIKRGYKIIMWDVLSKDYNTNITKQQCLQNVLKHTKNGSIIVCHDSLKAEKHLRYILPKILKYYTEKGYKFKAL